MSPGVGGFVHNHSDVAVGRSKEDEFPGVKCFDRLEVVTGPSDILFVPSLMWNAATNDSSTVRVRCGFIHLPDLVLEPFTLTFVEAFAGELSLPRWFYRLFPWRWQRVG